VYGTAVLDPEPSHGADLFVKVVELMAGQAVPPERRAQVEKLAREEERVVIRVTPHSTFATPPRHVTQMEDIDALSHWTSATEPW
jgi:hypothetical protein